MMLELNPFEPSQNERTNKETAQRTDVLTILLVEDHDDTRQSIRKTLTEAYPGIRVAEASDGPEALKWLQKQHADLILSDHRMPKMSGIQFLCQAKKIRPSAPRILMTAFPDFDVAKDAINEAHVMYFMPKPINHDDICTAVEQAMMMDDDLVPAP